jgi:hypothetical protein
MSSLKLEKTLLDDHGASAITSIVKGKDGKIYLGLTSYNHTFLEYEPKTGEITDLGEIFPQREGTNRVLDKIHNSLVVDDDGKIYIGQGLIIDWFASPYNFNLKKYGGGHLFSYDPAARKFEDYGIQVPLNSIHGLTIDRKNRKIFGYTIPDNHFFKFDMVTRETTDYGKISPYASHNFAADQNGNVYGAWKKDGAYDEAELKEKKFIIKGTFLMKYDGKQDELIRTKNMIVYGDEHDIFCNVGVDTWICTSKGEIFGGTAIGGVIFKVNRDDTIEYVGKPVMTPRLTSMVEGNDGLIYGSAGFPFMHIFSLNPQTKEIKDLGPISEEGDFCYVHCMAIGDDGTIYAGETDAGKACLYKITLDR